MPKPAACLSLLLALSWGAGHAFATSTPAVAVYNDVRTQNGAVTLIDQDSFAVLGTAEFGAWVRPLGFDATGRSLLVVASLRSGDAPTFLWSVDTETVASTPLGSLALETQAYFSDPDFKRLYAIGGTKKSKMISVFDLVALKPLGPLASVERMTVAQLSPDGAQLYAFCEGLTHKDPKGPPGNLHVLDAMTGTELARIEAGQNASSVGFDVKRGLVYVMGVADQDGNGTLTVLRGSSVVARLHVRGRPMALRFAPDGGSHLLTSSAVVALDADGLAARHTFALSFGPSDLIFDLGHDLMFARAGFGSKIAEMKMSGGDVIVEHATGSPGKKFGYGMANALTVVLAVGAAVGGTPLAGGLPFAAGPNPTSMLLGEDGAILYILNSYTDDVSLFDVAKRDVVDIVPAGVSSPERIVQLPGDPNFWLESQWSLAYFNTSTHRIDRTINRAIGLDTARERAWTAAKTKVLVFDLRSGEAVGLLDLPKTGTRIWIDNSRKPEPDAPHP